MNTSSATRELLRLYRRAWRHAWRSRKAMDAPPRLAHEIQFLPAALALQEQPVHPAPRYIQWVIMAFAALALLWACLGEIHVVATATGRIVPNGKSKVIQSSDVAVVKAIHVHDGQWVKAGDLLVELDAQITAADVERLKSDLLAAQVDNARARALLDAIQHEREPASLAEFIPQATPQQQQAAQRGCKGSTWNCAAPSNREPPRSTSAQPKSGRPTPASPPCGKACPSPGSFRPTTRGCWTRASSASMPGCRKSRRGWSKSANSRCSTRGCRN